MVLQISRTVVLTLVISFILLAICGYLFMENSGLKSANSDIAVKLNLSQIKIASLEKQQILAESDNFRLTTDLENANSNISFLEFALAREKQELENQKAALVGERAKSASIAANLSSLKNEIDSSIGWFKSNALFPENYSWASAIFSKRMVNDCMDNNEFNLACLSYLMENTAFAIHYRTDAEGKSGKADHLQSISESIDTQWGDCEDYSLLVKSELNLLRQKNCSELIAWTEGNSNFRVYPKESIQTEDYWYYPNAKKARMGNICSSYPLVVCYRADEYSGHCVVALSSKPVKSSAEISNLYGAHVFEPQTGYYLGVVGSDFKLCSTDDCQQNLNEIYFVIGDADLYIFSVGRWTGFEDKLQELEAM